MDLRVPFWHPLKWIAKMRSKTKDSSNLLLRIDTCSGHFGDSGRISRLKELSTEQAFLINAVASDH